MNLLFKLAAGSVVLTSTILLATQKAYHQQTPSSSQAPMAVIAGTPLPQPAVLREPSPHKIQAAILLDVSNSMDGLIAQAKAQLWNMVTVMGKATCDGKVPQIEIALYEYGRDTNDGSVGFVKQINSFTSDLDQLSQNLFGLSTNGGDEYCGHVIYSSLNELPWSQDAASYKVIFIAGNEDFLQGDIKYTRSCGEAREKGVIVNTIYCGDRQDGIREHWNLGGECGNGSYTNINEDAQMEDIATPYDDSLFLLNDQLNGTYVAYGNAGFLGAENQEISDKDNMSFNKSVAAKRIAVKGNKGLYQNTNWDLVDANEADTTILSKVDMKTLHDTLKNKTREELKQMITEKSKERNMIQNNIARLSRDREVFIVNEKAKSNGQKENTLETEIEKLIRQQALRFNMIIN